MPRRLFEKSVYVKVFTDRIVLKLLADGEKPLTVIAPKSFTTKRLLVGDFTIAEATLKNGLKKLFERHWFAPSPALVIHPMERVEEGLSPVEERILSELGLAAGARKVCVWVGHELSDEEARQRASGR